VTTLLFEDMAGIHAGQTVNIVGKGPSIQRLSAAIIDGHATIAISGAISAVDALSLTSTVYSLQKEGCNYAHDCRVCPGVSGIMVQIAERDIYIAQYPRSDRCMPYHPLRYEYRPHQVGIADNYDGGQSSIIAVMLAKHMGAARLRMLCFDSITHGDFTSFDPSGKIPVAVNRVYRKTSRWLRDALSDIAHEWVTPD
jgi:hypothetical protein